MPLLNPFYWLGALLLLAIVLLVSVGLGAMAYIVSKAAAKRNTRTTFLAPLPIGIVAGMVALGLSCSGILWFDDHPFPLQPKPAASDIEGQWAATQASLNDMQVNGGYAISTHTITFNTDGTFELLNMPDWCVVSFGKSNRGFLSGHGKWTIVADGDKWVIRLGFDHSSGNSAVVGIPAQLDMSGWRPTQIFEFIGDPDEGHAMVYEKST
jgi:hypothetical protein